MSDYDSFLGSAKRWQERCHAAEARLAEKESEAAHALTLLTDEQDSHHETRKRLAEAERDRLAATKLLFDWEVTSNRTGSVMDETRAYLKRVGYDPMTATLRATDSAPEDK